LLLRKQDERGGNRPAAWDEGVVTRRILLVDDDGVVREVLKEALQTEGFATVEAQNGEEGVAGALAHRPDLVISDIVMPEMDGWELCQTLRTLPSTRAIPFIFLTSLDQTPERVLASRLGADAYLTKPFDLPRLLHKVRELMGRLQDREDVIRGGETSVPDERMENILVDTIEFLKASVRTGVVSVRSGPSKGLVYLEKGQLKHAVFEGRKGEKALLTMLRLPRSQVSFNEGEYPKLPSNFKLTWDEFMTSLAYKG
jgi:CheY-like chemotaxis protein